MFTFAYYLKISLIILLIGFLYLFVGDLLSSEKSSVPLVESLIYFAVLAIPFSLAVLAWPTHKMASHWKVSHEAILRLSDREKKILSWHRKTENHSHDNFPAMTPRLTPKELDATIDKLKEMKRL